MNVNSLVFSNEKCFEILKHYEESKVKVYVSVVSINKEISEADIANLNSIKDLIVKNNQLYFIIFYQKIKQKTPLRVLHRRTLMVRDKIIHRMKAFKVNSKFMVN